MNEELELALAYWRTMAPQPKALVYIDAIEAKLKGEDSGAVVVDHELANAIGRAAAIARAKSLTAKDNAGTVSPLKGGYVRKGGSNPEPSRVITRPPTPAPMNPKRGRKPKAEVKE
ncbi:hypothetical protein [Shinella sp.]|uniref:hypothetical protein n=1 Tax=Shinella sp. TaxID=1870904 RepID=UPI00301E30DC